jgi:hypothetical protein
MRSILCILLCATLGGCGEIGKPEKPKTKLIYFGFDDHSEKSRDAISLAKTWGENGPCAHWRATIDRHEADYQVLFGDAEQITIVDRHGQLLYTGGEGVLSLPHGNPDGSGVNICKLTGEDEAGARQ